jgi:MSHA biogenesis protein MshJ
VNALRKLFVRINRSSLRERSLLFVAVISMLAMLWNQFLMAPLAGRRTVLALTLGEARERLAAANSGHGADSVADRYAELKAREAALGAALAATDVQLLDAQAGMIAPKDMTGVLSEVLGHQQGLTLVLLRNLPVESLLPPAGGQSASAPSIAMGPYLHPVELILRGDYLHVLAYLRELESRPWGFQWRRFELSTTDAGTLYRIEFTTLSMQSNWLGV